MKDIKVFNLKKKFNNKGSVIKLIQSSKLNKFGELYISIIKKKKIKGWKFHNKMNMNLFVIEGKVRFVFYNLKEKKFLQIISSDKNGKRIFVPKKTWFAFQNLSSSDSKILNFSNIIHDPKESQNEDLNFFSYKWKI